MLTRIVAFFLSFSISTLAFAENIEGYWDIEIPVMKGATNLSEKKDPRFSSINKSYDLIITDPMEVSQFYDKFFESNGWVNWAKGVAEVLDNQNDSNSFKRGWSSYHFDMNSNGTPQAIFQLTWNAKRIPAFANLRLELNDFSSGKYSGKVKISIIPRIDLESYVSEIHLLFKDPKNFFILSRAVKGNIVKFEGVDIDHLRLIKNSDPVIEKYYNIVTDTMNKYKEFQYKYNE